MDSYGVVALVVFISLCFLMAALLSFLAKRTPKWTVLVICVLLYAVSFTFSPGHSRELVGLVGFLRFMGIFGIIYGITIIRKKLQSQNQTKGPSLTR